MQSWKQPEERSESAGKHVKAEEKELKGKRRAERKEADRKGEAEA